MTARAKRNNPRDKKAPDVVRKGGARPAAAKPHGRARANAASNAAADEPKFVGGPRNEHGTRVARRITCMRCNKADHVPYVPRDPKKALCRACAVEVLKTYEAGVKVRAPTKSVTCNLCGAPFDLPVTIEDDGDLLCRNCLRGFTAWQGSIDVPFDERGQTVVEERLSGALVRKRTPPTKA